MDGYTQFTKEDLESISPQDALLLLKKGNERFVNDNPLNRNWYEEVKGVLHEQNPFATILSCMDSRVPPQLIFDQGLGDIFINRIAGNILNDDILGSMEFACNMVGSKVILILGHTECGAIKGAIDKVRLGNLTGLLNKIEPVIDSLNYNGERTSEDCNFVDLVTHENVKFVMNEIKERSSILSKLVKDEKLMIDGRIYNVSTGEVNFYE